jgi:hypothetical protein
VRACATAGIAHRNGTSSTITATTARRFATAAYIAPSHARIAAAGGALVMSGVLAPRSASSSSSTWRTISAVSACLLGKYSYSDAMPTPASSATWLVVRPS